jgi:hypothetical protein
MCENTPELVSVPVSSCDFVLIYNFRLFNPPESPRSVYRFLVAFCFELFLPGVDLKLGGIMASSSGDKEKSPPEDDAKDFRLIQEVESEDEEEDQSPRPNTVITSARSGRKSKVQGEQGPKTLLLKDRQKLDVSFLMICRDQHIMFWMLTPCP